MKVLLVSLASLVMVNNGETYECDVLVYESTPSGIIASIAASNNTDINVILLSTNKDNFGGMCTNGLGKTDIGNTSVIGGLSREFFIRNGQYYNKDIEWYLEPHVALEIYQNMTREANVTVIYDSPINQDNITIINNTIKSINTINGNTYNCLIYVDASYEADLMYSANVSYTMGRESNTTYNESMNGRLVPQSGNNFNIYVNPFDSDGNPLPMITPFDNETPGEYDNKMEAYNYRLCVTKNQENMIRWCDKKPESYNETYWELYRRQNRIKPVQINGVPSCNTGAIPNSKYDMNNCGSISTDFVGESNTYINSSYNERAIIAEKHKNYTYELIWFLCTDNSVPENVRNEMINNWGFCKDEFKDNNGFPTQLYIREARRMIGEYVFKQSDAESQNVNIGTNSIGMGSYGFDTHNVQRLACNNKSQCIHSPPNLNGCNNTNTNTCVYTINEGDLEVHPHIIFEMPYQILVPKKEEISNMFNSVTVSASHVGYANLRLEPQYMIFGHAVGIASKILIDNHKTNGTDIITQNIDLNTLSNELQQQNAILHCDTIVNDVCQ